MIQRSSRCGGGGDGEKINYFCPQKKSWGHRRCAQKEPNRKLACAGLNGEKDGDLRGLKKTIRHQITGGWGTRSKEGIENHDHVRTTAKKEKD